VYCFKVSLKKMPTDHFKCQAYIYLARIMYEYRKYKPMYSYIKKALQVEPHPDGHYLLMVNAIENKNPKSAMEEMARFILACNEFEKNPRQRRSRYITEKKEIEKLLDQAMLLRDEYVTKLLESKERT
jgi:hypothetical protein